MDDIQQEVKESRPKTFISSPWTIILILSVVCLGVGYFLGVQTNPITSKLQSTPPVIQVPVAKTLSSCLDADIDYANINGVFATNTDYYDQIYITVNELKNGVTTKTQYDTRQITKPQPNIQYPYQFNRVVPGLTYLVSFSACHNNPNGTMICTNTAQVSNCSGKTQNSSCIITDSGTVNFSLSK